MEKRSAEHMGMVLRYETNGESYGIKQFSPGTNRNGYEGEIALPNFDLTIAGDDYGVHSGVMTGGSTMPLQCRCVSADFSDTGAVFVYEHLKSGLEIKVNLLFIPEVRMIRQINRVTNRGSSPVTLTHCSSMRMQGIATDGLLPWYDSRKIKVHFCQSTWEGEGQWRSGSLEDLGVYPTSVHQCVNTFHVSSVGSWSTTRFAPMSIIEDQETGQVWYFQIESSTSWHYEIGLRKQDNGTQGTLYMLADCADELHGGWYKTLMPGDSFETMPVAFGCTYGGFEEAVKELTTYRRGYRKPANAWESECPLVYNDYMNALWGHPTEERLIPLVDAAASAGAEVFCIDAGWFGPRSNSWGNGLGDWIPSTDRFGEKGLEGILNRIKKHGMIPGLWLEVDACQKLADAYKLPDQYFLMRHGKRIGGERVFFDFRNPDVRAYLHARIDDLVAKGVGYFKNDYNQSTGVGDDKAGNNASADGLVENAVAFYRFLDEVRERHPRLILENCGGGGLRQDYGALSHFHLQSTSDQEEYDRYPSIILGSLANLLPEQAGIWSYPYPLLFMEMINAPDIVETEAFKRRFENGEQTIFNMVNGLCGNLYLSGRIEFADDYNKSLIQEGTALYKQERNFIRRAYPVWPTGMLRMNDRSWASVGLLSAEGDRMLLAVWRLAEGGEYWDIPLSKWTRKVTTVKRIYPAENKGESFQFNPGSRSLSVRLPQPLSARLFEIQFED